MGELIDEMRRWCHETRIVHTIRGAFKKAFKYEEGDRSIAVSDMQETSSTAQADIAGNTKADRLAFILKGTIRGKLREFKASVADARRAWFGKGLN